ncbi:MAG: hypothetical protein AB7S69_13100 [Salinivirgaceae bacterium]
MKKIFFIIYVFLSTFICFGQNLTGKNSFIDKYNKNEKCYNQKAEALIKRELTKENIFNSYTAKQLLEKSDYFLVPMFKAKLKDDINYVDVNDFLSSLSLCKKLWFHDIAVFKKDTLIGIYNCNELGSCGFSLCSDTPNSSNDIMIDLQRVKNIEHDHVFYVHGILHAWWIVKENDIQVYYLLDGNFYTPQVFLDKYYTDDKIRKIIMYYR